MASGVMFTKAAAQRIADATRGFESTPLGASAIARVHHQRRGGSSGSSVYSSPFAVVDSSSEESGLQVTLCGNNHDAGRYWVNTVTLGLYLTTVDEQSIPVSSSVYIYLKITCPSGTYIVEVASASSVPAQTETEYYIPIAYVKVANSAIFDITQIQHGQAEGSGRIF